MSTVMEKNSKESRKAVGEDNRYADGHALDQVQYLEAKLILKPDRFTSVDSFRDFGKLVKRAAKDTDVGFISDPVTCPHLPHGCNYERS